MLNKQKVTLTTLFEKADQGELRNFPGVTAKYEAPSDPDLVLNAADQSVDQCADAVIELLQSKGIIK